MVCARCLDVFRILLKRDAVARIVVAIALLIAGIPTGVHASTGEAASLDCPDEYRITVDFENGAGWDFCWQSKQRENIVLSDIHFKSPDGLYTRVISSLRLAQLHVTYDDSVVTYNDVTQFGLGGGYIADLAASECADGELLNINNKQGMCKLVTQGDDAFRSTTESRLTQTLTLFSISQVGAYSYIVTWKFHDNGSIEPSVGAAGALQRSSSDAGSPFGRQLEGADGKSWLSHTHNYYWRIDFDLGANSMDDVVSEVSYRNDVSGRRVRSVERFTTETARRISPENMLSWLISDGPAQSTTAKAYAMEPLHYGHRLVRSEVESHTEFDFFVTRQSDCERFVSENQKFNPQCGDSILDFINTESLIDQDIVVWHRVSFHHIPRNEDRNRMHSHWDGFMMQARNLSSSTPGHNGLSVNVPPSIEAPLQLINEPGDVVSIALLSDDPDGDSLSYSAEGLPNGISLTSVGMLQGVATDSGNYRSIVSVTDGKHTTNALIQWQISGDASGAGSISLQLLWLFFLLAFQRQKTVH